ncbi:MAG: hypothetical protein C0482_02325 [Gordonia sp.]|nr:hypothetical protein [Gordonia sp. (in: high G+C Gram-positive bacteria)]
MKKAAVGGLTIAGCMLAACSTADHNGHPPSPSISESSYLFAEWVTDEPPDPGTTIERASIEATIDGRPITIINFTMSCTRSGDGDELSVAA